MVVNKSKSAFRTIAEVAEELGVATHVLRFWETKFNQIKPMKASGGRRYYRPDDVEIVKLIKSFLYEKRYTIEGVQKLFKDKGLKAILGGEIQKDFFDISADETISEGQIEATYGLTQMQRQVLTEAYNELKQIEELLSGEYNKLWENLIVN
jgi:DNA-binding transcriptional MerR regulator